MQRRISWLREILRRSTPQNDISLGVLNVQGTTSIGPHEWLGQSLDEILDEGQNPLTQLFIGVLIKEASRLAPEGLVISMLSP